MTAMIVSSGQRLLTEHLIRYIPEISSR
jgi:hypothetical protein